MITIKGRVREWGNSLGIIIPRENVKEAGLVKDQEITIDVKTENPVKAAFGSLKGWKVDAQKVKDELRKEWSKW